MLVFYLYSGMYVSECESVCGCYLNIWCMRDELGEFHLIDESLVSSVRVHNNCELPVNIYNICEYLVWVGRRCSARCGVDICD